MTSNRRWTYQGPGNPLRLSTAAIPVPGADQVLVRNRAIGLNPVDWKLVAGGHPNWPVNHVPGVDGAGEVVALGDGVAAHWLGRRVCYHGDLKQEGSFADYTLVDLRALIPIPDSVSWSQAAAFPCPGLTAWQVMSKLPDLQGAPALVCGAGGAVGSLVTQMLLQRGERVWVTAASSHHDALKAQGVDRCFDYRESDWRQQVEALGGVHAVVDLVSQAHAAQSANLLDYGGHLVAVLGRVEAQWPAFGRTLSLHEVALGAIYGFGTRRQFEQLTGAGEALLRQVGSGKLTLPSLGESGFSDLGAVLTELSNGNLSGKQVILC